MNFDLTQKKSYIGSCLPQLPNVFLENLFLLKKYECFQSSLSENCSFSQKTFVKLGCRGEKIQEKLGKIEF